LTSVKEKQFSRIEIVELNRSNKRKLVKQKLVFEGKSKTRKENFFEKNFSMIDRKKNYFLCSVLVKMKINFWGILK